MKKMTRKSMLFLLFMTVTATLLPSCYVRCDESGDLLAIESDVDSVTTLPDVQQKTTTTEREREPLDPNYHDPSANVKPSSSQPPSEAGAAHQKPQEPSRPITIFDIAHGGGDFLAPSFGQSDIFSSLFGSFGDFHHTLQPWWKGPNVCIEREEEKLDEDDSDVKQEQDMDKNGTEINPISHTFHTSISLSNCQQTFNKYQCTTKINNHGAIKSYTVTYKCCYGYERTENSMGCQQKLILKPLMDTIRELGAKEFATMVESTGNDVRLAGGNFTIFVPTDTALEDFNNELSTLNNVDLKERDNMPNALTASELVSSLIVPGFVDLRDLVNEEIIRSGTNDIPIRINVYPTPGFDKMVTANCARVSKPNNLAENGIVHMVDNIAAPATQALDELIASTSQLSDFHQVLQNADFYKHFKPDRHYTIFAPTNKAFAKLDAPMRERLLRAKADEMTCSPTILRHHITPHTVCSCAIVGNATSHNLDGVPLSMERKPDNTIMIEDEAEIVATDLMATNGVVHLIDKVLIPEAAQSINEALANQNFTKFMKLIESIGMVDEVNDLVNATVFAPRDEAFDEPKNKRVLEEIGDDTEQLKQLVLYHMAKGKLQSNDMTDDTLVDTNAGQPLRINLYSTVPLFSNLVNRATVNCARVTGFDEPSCSSVIHEVNDLLIPPQKSIMEVISNEPKYTTLAKLIKDTEIEDLLRSSNHSLTLLAPTDETFAAIDDSILKMLQDDSKKAVRLMKNHILKEVLCCSGIGEHTFGFNTVVKTMTNEHLQLARSSSGRIHIGRAVVIGCDNVATNGVIHSINHVLFPKHHRPTQQIADLAPYLFFGF